MDCTRHELLRQLTALDFVLVDLQLYLDTHPADQVALAQFNSTLMQADMLRRSYERMFGPLTSYRSPSIYPWQWISNPWPWQYDFNFEIDGKECDDNVGV